ncbi:hypothetical protein APSETT444_001114 [Aspergillus pseudonomiae]
MKRYRSASHFWDSALNKIFPRRASRSRSDERNTFLSFESSTTSEHTDGFYMYSQALLEQENRRRGALLYRQSDSTEASYSSALMAPIPRPALPYTISSHEWNIFSEAVKALEGAIDDDASDWLHSVLSVFSKVYTVAKIIVTILRYYGIEVEDIPDSVPAHIRRAEEIVTSNSITELIEAVESLYYSVYARLIMEIANVDLSTYFNLELRRTSRKDGFTLPEPDHLLKILAHCKDTLEAPTVCNHVNVNLIRVHQDEFIRRAMERAIGTEFFLDDLLGYRRYTMGIVSDTSSEFRSKWNHDTFLYQIPPEEILTVQSEKYLSFIPKPEAVLTVTGSDLPFVDRDSIDPELWERELVKDHRQAALAKMEGKGIGDVRRVDERRLPSDYMKERKCICRSSCICSWECTSDPERPCPCTDRMMQIMLAKHRKAPGTRDFATRCGNLAKAIFECASLIKRDIDDIEIALELDRVFLLVDSEIEAQRRTPRKANGVKSSKVERGVDSDAPLDPVEYLQRAYEETIRATTDPNEWYGTTTSVTAILHWTCDDTGNEKPLLYVTNVGDCKLMVIRPSEEKILFRTKEQWHWFDCPMQLGTNSVDTPRKDAVMSQVDLEEEDVVLAVSDGVLDNLWEHEILSITLDSIKKWNQGRYDNTDLEWAPPEVLAEERMVFVARELLKSALAIAQDPFAESPFMEKAIEEGLAIEGGK